MAHKFTFEHKGQPLLPVPQFLRRIRFCFGISFLLLWAVIGIGTIAYHLLENLSWLDALLDSVLIISGLGLQEPVRTAGGKLFTVLYSLGGAFTFYTTLAIFFSPLLHRFLHRLHLDMEGEE